MAKAKYKHNNFSAGQYDREFMGQESSAIHQNGLSYGLNVLSSVQGECKARPGTEWKADISSQAVIIPFCKGTQDLGLVFQSGTLDIVSFDADGNMKPYNGGTTNTVVWTNTSNTEPASTPVSVSGDITGNTNNFYKSFTQNVSQQLQDYSNNNLSVAQKTYPVGYFNMEFTGKKTISKVVMGLLPADGNFNQPDFSAASTWIKDAVLQYSDNGSDWYTMQLAAPWKFTGYRQSTTYGTRVVQSLQLQPLNPSSHQYWRVQIVFLRTNMTNNAKFCVNFQGNVTEETVSIPETLPSPYTTDNLKNLKYTQQYNEMIICDGEHKPYAFTLNGNTPVFTEKSYNFGSNVGVPACTRFFQNRLWFAGFTAYPTRVIGSAFNNYSNFIVNDENAVATDPIRADGNQIQDRITDLWGGFTVLYAQSSDGISFIESAGDAVAPTRMNFTLKCYEKASGVTPVMKENIMFYVGQNRKKIHAFTYDRNIEQFVAPDISQYWQEVLKERISELVYADTRNRNIIGILDDGTAFALLYDRSGVIGYFPIDVGGKIYDASVLRNGDEVGVYFTVNRNNIWSIEKLHLPAFMQRTNAFLQSDWERNLATQENLLKVPYIDCWKTFKNEKLETWQYNADNSTLEPVSSTANPTNLTPYIGKVVRFYYGDGIRDYVSAKIIQAYTEQQETQKEIDVPVNVPYVGWSYVNSIVVQPISGHSPVIKGNYTRYPQGDGQHPSGYMLYAWTNGTYTRYTRSEFPNIGDSFLAWLGGTNTRTVPVATVSSRNGGSVLTKTTFPATGTTVYDLDFSVIGSTTNGQEASLAYNGNTYYRDESIDKSRTETTKETITVVVTAGSYQAEIKEADQRKSNLFIKMQLPIELIGTPSYYAWSYGVLRTVFTLSPTPAVGDKVYMIDSKTGDFMYAERIVVYVTSSGSIQIGKDATHLDQGYFERDSAQDHLGLDIASDTYQVQDNGVYQGEFSAEGGYIRLKNPMYNIQYGYPYKKIAVITEMTNKGYLKQWGTIAASLIDTMDLKIGSSMATLEQLIEFRPSIDYYNSNPIMYNGIILKNIADTDAYEKNLILYSDKGLPFCINGLEAEMLIADQGGN